MLLLYLNSRRYTAKVTLNLHSTMLLLYRVKKCYYLYTSAIYIPLCFYFIGSAPGYHDACLLIYIPLCFYFILVDATIEYIHSIFTFHYASTLSGRWCSIVRRHKNHLHSTMLLLYREWRFEGCGRVHNLHSTMLLLYLNTFSSSSERFKIYIPLCFYFITGRLTPQRSGNRFTFHYASTLSKREYL